MKTLLLSSMLALLVTAGTMKAQDRADDYLGLPGDNLNLYAVMNLFQESETLEAFERNLNDENSRINNLDLNGDNYVDYISVSDFPDGNVHTIVLQTSLNPKEKQDVAVFTVERMRNGDVQIQLIGDEALYGRNYIIEPYYAETPNPAYRGNARPAERTTYVYVSAWPVVRHIYDPYYVQYRSSWYWGYYPQWYHTWSPFYWHHYHGYHYNFYDSYYAHYRHWDRPRWGGYNTHYYRNVRVFAPTVIVNINRGTYKQTYSRPETRSEGERMYARVQASRGSNLSDGTTRRASVNEGSSTTNRSREATTSTTRRAPTSTATRSSSQTSRETVRNSNESRSTTTRSATENRSVARPSTSESRSVARPSSSQTRSTEARPSSSQTRSTEARPSSSQTRSTEARPSSSQTRSTEARPSSSQARTETARSSAPAQNRTESARSSSAPSQSRTTAARSSSSPRQQSASAPRSASRQSAPAAKSSRESSKSSSDASSRSAERKSRR